MNRTSQCLVQFQGKEVGRLFLDDGAVYFTYASSWVDQGFSISPLSLPLEKERVFRSKGDHFDGLFGVFADSLPDGWGTRLAVKALARQGINYGDLNPLERLSYVGDDGLGGLEYYPHKDFIGAEESQDYERLAMAALAFCDDGEPIELDELFLHGGSSGGARPKAHLRIDDEEWIVKFRERKDPPYTGALEYEYNLAAEACGIRVSPCRLLPSSLCDGYFASKRFDREAGERIHTLSLCALLESPHYLTNLDYVTYLQATGYITQSQEEVIEAFRRACFNVFAQNKDDHSKNFSYYYDLKKGRYLLSPAYDLTYTPIPIEHVMTCNGNGNPTKDDLLAIAARVHIPLKTATKIIDEIEATVHKLLGKWIKSI